MELKFIFTAQVNTNSYVMTAVIHQWIKSTKTGRRIVAIKFAFLSLFGNLVIAG